MKQLKSVLAFALLLFVSIQIVSIAELFIGRLPTGIIVIASIALAWVLFRETRKPKRDT